MPAYGLAGEQAGKDEVGGGHALPSRFGCHQGQPSCIGFPPLVWSQ